jgi:PmbA protein
MVETALSGSTEATVDGDLSFASPSAPPAVDFSGLFDPTIETASEKEKIKTALEIEKSAVGYDKAVTRVRGASFSESLSAWRVLNSRGVDVTGEATYFTGSVMAVAGSDGDSQMGYEAALGHKRGDVDPAWVGKEAARRAVEALGAGRIETRKGSVVFENMVVIELLGTLAGSFFAGNVARGKSMLAGREGEKVLSELINIYDDGVLAGGWASAPFDAEGVARRKTPLIGKGVCSGFLYDTYWGVRLGHESTGNSVRGGFKGSPSVGTTNLYMEGGSTSLEGLFELMGDGLFITEMMGVHTVDTVTGEFSLGASGFLVEGGKVAGPVRGFAVSGTLLELLSCVEAVGSDLRHLGSVGAPSLLVCDVDASGA